MTKKFTREMEVKSVAIQGYTGLLSSVSQLLEQARYTAARSVNTILTATYWEIGHRIVEFEQKGADVRNMANVSWNAWLKISRIDLAEDLVTQTLT